MIEVKYLDGEIIVDANLTGTALTAELVNELYIHTTVTSMRQALAVKPYKRFDWQESENEPKLSVAVRVEDTTPIKNSKGEDTDYVPATLHVLSRDLERYLLLKSIQQPTE